jgi:hypothetical protein
MFNQSTYATRPAVNQAPASAVLEAGRAPEAARPDAGQILEPTFDAFERREARALQIDAYPMGLDSLPSALSWRAVAPLWLAAESVVRKKSRSGYLATTSERGLQKELGELLQRLPVGGDVAAAMRSVVWLKWRSSLMALEGVLQQPSHSTSTDVLIEKFLDRIGVSDASARAPQIKKLFLKFHADQFEAQTRGLSQEQKEEYKRVDGHIYALLYRLHQHLHVKEQAQPVKAQSWAQWFASCMVAPEPDLSLSRQGSEERLLEESARLGQD